MLVDRHRSLALLSLYIVTVSVLGSNCSRPIEISEPVLPSMTSKANVFDEYMSLEFPPADGFALPVGDPDGKGSYKDKTRGSARNGWFIKTQFGEKNGLGINPGEDWNGGFLLDYTLRQAQFADQVRLTDSELHCVVPAPLAQQVRLTIRSSVLPPKANASSGGCAS